MELKEFVAASLLQITTGVHQAQTDLAESGIGARVNPNVMDMGAARQAGMQVYQGSPVQNIEFDVAVAVTEGSHSNVGGKASIAVAWLGANKQESGQTSALHRIRFTVPVVLPVGPAG